MAYMLPGGFYVGMYLMISLFVSNCLKNNDDYLSLILNVGFFLQ